MQIYQTAIINSMKNIWLKMKIRKKWFKVILTAINYYAYERLNNTNSIIFINLNVGFEYI